MRKYTKYIALGIILFMVTLSFASKNNLGFNFLDIGWSTELKEIPKKEVEERVKEKVTDPITASLTVRNPHMFMTKCYSRLESDLGERGGDLELRKFYENQTVTGNVTLTECGSADVICKYQLSLNTNEVTVRESFLEPWVPLDEFLTKIETTNRADQ